MTTQKGRAVRLISDKRQVVTGPNHVTSGETGPGEAPVIRDLDRISERWTLAVPQAAGMIEAHAGHVVLWACLLPAIPLPSLAPGDVFGRGRQLRAHKGRFCVCQLNAPAGDVPT